MDMKFPDGYQVGADDDGVKNKIEGQKTFEEKKKELENLIQLGDRGGIKYSVELFKQEIESRRNYSQVLTTVAGTKAALQEKMKQDSVERITSNEDKKLLSENLGYIVSAAGHYIISPIFNNTNGRILEVVERDTKNPDNLDILTMN